MKSSRTPTTCSQGYAEAARIGDPVPQSDDVEAWHAAVREHGGKPSGIETVN